MDKKRASRLKSFRTESAFGETFPRNSHGTFFSPTHREKKEERRREGETSQDSRSANLETGEGKEAVAKDPRRSRHKPKEPREEERGFAS